MSYGNTLEGQILDHLFGLATWTAPTHLWIALSTADPGEDGSSIAEPSGNGYGRVQCDPGSGQWVRSGSVVDNVAEIAFAEATGSWGTITHVAVFTAETGGTFLYSFALTASKTITTGQTPRFPAGTFDNTQD